MHIERSYKVPHRLEFILCKILQKCEIVLKATTSLQRLVFRKKKGFKKKSKKRKKAFELGSLDLEHLLLWVIKK
jgi:hypothetical protein